MATCSHDNKVRLFDMAVLEDDGEEDEEDEKDDSKDSDDDDADENENSKDNEENEESKDSSSESEEDKDNDSSAKKPQKRTRDDSGEEDAKPAITKKKSVSARNLKRQKIIPNKSSGFFDDLWHVF